MRRKHRCFDVTTPAGNTARIHGDPGMSRETMDALMQMMDLAYEQMSAIEMLDKTKDQCLVCSTPIEQPALGRRRKYCADCATQLRHRTPALQARKSTAENPTD